MREMQRRLTYMLKKKKKCRLLLGVEVWWWSGQTHTMFSMGCEFEPSFV